LISSAEERVQTNANIIEVHAAPPTASTAAKEQWGRSRIWLSTRKERDGTGRRDGKIGKSEQ
jgi:hypothetical protein